MALPKLETPTYELTLPSTGQKIKYRPFLVKEYKVLLTALDSDSSEIQRTVTELVDVCTFNKLNADSLPNFDIEYLFLNIRAKSIGEVSTILMKCEKCETEMTVDMDITKTEILKDPTHNSKIQITDDITIEMRYPKFSEIMEIYLNLNTDKIVDLIGQCIKTVYTVDSKYDDFTKEELNEFINSFSRAQFEKLEQFFLTMPKVAQIIEKDCPNCSHHNVTTVEGLQNFFA